LKGHGVRVDELIAAARIKKMQSQNQTKSSGDSKAVEPCFSFLTAGQHKISLRISGSLWNETNNAD
jgi:hypothetical protein